MNKLFKFFFIFFVTFSTYSQDISWLNIDSKDDKTVFKSDSDALSKKLNNTRNNTTTQIRLPINEFNLEEFNLTKESGVKNQNEINVQLYKGVSRNLKDKVFVNVIGE